MCIKKLILPLLALFVLTVFSYAATIANPSFIVTPDNFDFKCNFLKQTPESEVPNLPDKSYTFKVGQYAGKITRLWTLLENALTKDDKSAAELIKYCFKGNGSPYYIANKDGVTFLTVAAYYGGKNAENISRYLVKHGGLNVDMVIGLNTKTKWSSRNALAGAVEGNRLDSAKYLVDLGANPYIEIEDEGEKMKVIEFAEKRSQKVFDFLKTIKGTTALMQDAVYKTIYYTMNDKDQFSRLMEEVKSKGIVADFLRALDSNSLFNTTYNNLI
jgi:hypothetical protein